MTRLTDAELAELAGGITPGPWHHGKSIYDRTPEEIEELGEDEWDGIYEVWCDEEMTRVAPNRSWVAITCMEYEEQEANAQAIARVPDLLADLIAAREALRGMTAIFEQMLIHPDDTMYDARFWKQIAREGIAQGEIG